MKEEFTPRNHSVFFFSVPKRCCYLKYQMTRSASSRHASCSQNKITLPSNIILRWWIDLQCSLTYQGSTGVSNGFPEKKASRLPIVVSRRSDLDSDVKTATWGVITTLSMEKSSGGTLGSFSKTSRPAPAILPSFSAWTNSISSTFAPRPMFMMIPSFPRASRTSLLTMCRVSLFNAHATTSTSDSEARSWTLGKYLYGTESLSLLEV